MPASLPSPSLRALASCLLCPPVCRWKLLQLSVIQRRRLECSPLMLGGRWSLPKFRCGSYPSQRLSFQWHQAPIHSLSVYRRSPLLLFTANLPPSGCASTYLSHSLKYLLPPSSSHEPPNPNEALVSGRPPKRAQASHGEPEASQGAKPDCRSRSPATKPGNMYTLL